MDVYVLFEIGPCGLDAYLGTFSSESKAVENARVFLNAVLLYDGDEVMSYDDVMKKLTSDSTIVLTDQPNKCDGVIILKSKVDVANYSVK